jgi:hypothetical protein
VGKLKYFCANSVGSILEHTAAYEEKYNAEFMILAGYRINSKQAIRYMDKNVHIH